MIPHRFFKGAAVAALIGLTIATRAQAAALVVVTPGEQNTASGENGCAATPCQNGHWLHYPELLGVALGAGYVVHNNGDGGAVLGCDTTTATAAGNNSFCKSTQYTSSLTPTPDIVIIGPFGEHDQRIVTSSGADETALYKESVFEAAYEGLVQKYLKGTTKVYMMTPIDVPWGGTTNLPAGEDLVKDVMLPAAIAVACNHNLTIIDTYTAISGTPTLVTQYYGTDGQVTSAGQQKMATLIEAALASTSGNGPGVCPATGAGGAGGGAGASGAAGAGGAAGASGAAGVSGAAGAGAAGASGAAGATGAAGANGAAGLNGAAGAGAAGAGVAGSSGGAAGAPSTAGAAGTSGAAGTGTTIEPPERSSGGCAIAGSARGCCGGGLALAVVVGVAIARRRRRRARR